MREGYIITPTYEVQELKDISQEINGIECVPMHKMSVNGADKTLNHGEGSSADIAIVGASYLKSLGYEPKVLNFPYNGENPVSPYFLSTPVVQKDDSVHALGLYTPEGVIGNYRSVVDVNHLAREFDSELRDAGYKPRGATVANLDDIVGKINKLPGEKIDWEGKNDCAPLFYWLTKQADKVRY